MYYFPIASGRILAKRFFEQKNPLQCVCTVRDEDTARGSTLLAKIPATHLLCQQKEQWKFSHFIDGNGITGPDWGHSEVVFNWVLLKRSHHARFSLEQSAAYSSRQRVNLIESGFIIVRDNPFVNLYRKKTLPRIKGGHSLKSIQEMSALQLSFI